MRSCRLLQVKIIYFRMINLLNSMDSLLNSVKRQVGFNRDYWEGFVLNPQLAALIKAKFYNQVEL